MKLQCIPQVGFAAIMSTNARFMWTRNFSIWKAWSGIKSNFPGSSVCVFVKIEPKLECEKFSALFNMRLSEIRFHWCPKKPPKKEKKPQVKCFSGAQISFFVSSYSASDGLSFNRGHGWLIINFVDATSIAIKVNSWGAPLCMCYGLWIVICCVDAKGEEKQFEKLDHRVIDYKLHPLSVRLISRRFCGEAARQKRPVKVVEWQIKAVLICLLWGERN